MAVVKTSVFWILMTFLWTLTRGDAEVFCFFTERCILPCTFKPGADAIIHWIQETGRKENVHSYYRSQDQLGHQGQHFRGRTSLFKDQISSGNASLQLTGVEVQDQGRYKCYTSTITGQDSFISLKVEAPVGKVNLQQVENNIICSSQGIYPEPQLTWSTSPPSDETFKNTTEIQRTEQLLYNISSSLTLTNTDLNYTCTISTDRNRRRATLFKPTSITVSSTEVTIPCTESKTSFKSLVWRFNHSEIIVDQAVISERWKQHVNNESPSGSIKLHNLASHHEGTYTCELSDGEETLITNTFVRIEKDPVASNVAGVAGGVVAGVVVALLFVIVLVLGFICRHRILREIQRRKSKDNERRDLQLKGHTEGEASRPLRQTEDDRRRK